MVEHLMYGYSAGMATDLVRAGEAGARRAGALPEKKDPRPSGLRDIPVVGRLFVRKGTTRILNDFYVLRRELEERRTADRAGKAEMAAEDESRLSHMNRVANRMSEKSRQVRQVLKKEDWTDDKKRETIRKLVQERADLARGSLRRVTK